MLFRDHSSAYVFTNRGKKNRFPQKRKIMTDSNRILLVEDQEETSAIQAALLKELGYDCDIASSGTMALGMIFLQPYALAIIDVQMPGMNGLEMTRTLRLMEKERNLAPIPVIGTSGNATSDDRFFGLKAGMNDFLSKPFRLTELEQKIKSIMFRFGQRYKA
jgi:DNA-binding response OmpR family regulator